MVKINFPSNFQIILFLTSFFIIFVFILYLLRNKKLFGKKLAEYVWPIKFYFLVAAIAVFLQYLAMSWQWSGRIGQLLWELMIVFSVVTLVKKCKFNLKNIAFLGILYALWIHGAKCSLRYFVYGKYDFVYRTFRYLAGRFIYGSILAITISIAAYFAFFLVKEANKERKNWKEILKSVLGLILVLIILLISVKFYGKYA